MNFSPTAVTEKEATKSNSSLYLKSIAKNFQSLAGIARDMNVARQNVQKLVTLKGGEKATGADAHFLKSKERAEKLDVEVETERAKDIEFFEKEDIKEAELEKKKAPTLVTTKPAEKGKPKKASPLDKLKEIFSSFLGVVKNLFNPKMIMQVLGKLALPLLIVTTIWQGIKGAWDAYQETGSIWEAFKGGIGEIVDFFSFGLIDKKMVSEFMDEIPKFFESIIEAASNFFGKIGEWFSEKFDGVKELFVKPKTPAPAAISTPPAKPAAAPAPAQGTQETFPGAEEAMKEQRAAAEAESLRRKEEAAKKKAEEADAAKKKAEADQSIARAAAQEEARKKAEEAEAAKKKAEAAKKAKEEELAKAKEAERKQAEEKKKPAPPPPPPPKPAAAPKPTPLVPKLIPVPEITPKPIVSEPISKAPAPAEEIKVSPIGKFNTKEEFIKGLFPYAQAVSEKIGAKVPPMAILGQWAGESGVGKNLPAPFNYAGIKAGKQFKKGDFVLTEERYTDKQIEQAEKSGESLERILGPNDKIKKKERLVTIDEWYGKGTYQKTIDEGKKWVQIRSYFAAFDGLKDFAESFAGFISSPRYAKARQQTTAEGFGYEIAKAGYATASAEKYSAKIAGFASENENVAPGPKISQASTEVASGQRQQQKPSTPVVINTTTVNNTSVNKNVSTVTTAKENTGNKLASRVA